LQAELHQIKEDRLYKRTDHLTPRRGHFISTGEQVNNFVQQTIYLSSHPEVCCERYDLHGFECHRFDLFVVHKTYIKPSRKIADLCTEDNDSFYRSGLLMPTVGFEPSIIR
jgi:hypothetical protein